MRIVDAAGRDLPPREIGEIVGRGPIRMQGYYKRPDLTEQAIRDGWIFSGDLGYVDEDGYLYLVDRKKDMIDSGGMKVYPKDVEEIAARHPAIREIAVFGVPHDKWGETPLAAVILRDGAMATAEELRDWINEQVAARYQRVSEVVIMRIFLAAPPGRRSSARCASRTGPHATRRSSSDGPRGSRASQRGRRPHLRFGLVRQIPVLPDHFFQTVLRATVVWVEVVAEPQGIHLQMGRAFILETDDLVGLVGRMESSGFVFRKPIHDEKAFKYVMIAGPDDLLIELFECNEPARWRIRSDDEN